MQIKINFQLKLEERKGNKKANLPHSCLWLFLWCVRGCHSSSGGIPYSGSNLRFPFHFLKDTGVKRPALGAYTGLSIYLSVCLQLVLCLLRIYPGERYPWGWGFWLFAHCCVPIPRVSLTHGRLCLLMEWINPYVEYVLMYPLFLINVPLHCSSTFSPLRTELWISKERGQLAGLTQERWNKEKEKIG